MEYQSDINSTMRTILVDWLIEVADEYRLNDETLFLCVHVQVGIPNISNHDFQVVHFPTCFKPGHLLRLGQLKLVIHAIFPYSDRLKRQANCYLR